MMDLASAARQTIAELREPCHSLPDLMLLKNIAANRLERALQAIPTPVAQTITQDGPKPATAARHTGKRRVLWDKRAGARRAFGSS